MDEQMTPSAFSGTLHHYSEKLCAFEYGSASERPKPHSLLFIGGLSDGLGTVPYIKDLAKTLEPTSWSVFAVLLSSSYNGWGMVSLDKDVEEIGNCVKYVKTYKSAKNGDTPTMVALMGHSTGSQDVLHYLYSVSAPDRPQVEGAILQAPVSDRENLLQFLRAGDAATPSEELTKVYDGLVYLAKVNVTNCSKNAILPLASTARIGLDPEVPMSSHRFLSLASPDSPESPLEDDLFSSDLGDERLEQTFGAICSKGILKGSLLVLPGGSDEYIKKGHGKSWYRGSKGI
ncbi:conserved hypothetical protein [Uncinocarpus reesii 1704]|uniref:Dolichol-phosphate mannosyltransferase n=1 Tax=Uncinocarpus reesii (strain UAMH 1704) TaxID=336963 RepID=C4JYW9_UNCRE|nr:uncharacterized protein UREG_07370 [Uncinocarpus reesii 1704]EEP82505.1 conserved hypothetical protein [Uncinocarpus reesii 1704]